MLRDIRKNRTFNRRALVVGSAQSALAGILVMRLGYLQLFKHKEYSIKSDSNRIKAVIDPAPRGIVFDRKGVQLTKNKSSYRLLFYFDRRRKIDNLLENLSEILKLTPKEKAVFAAKIKNKRRKTIVSLIDNLGWDDLARIESNSHLLPGISIESGTIRRYLYSKETAHILGYVSFPSEQEVQNNEQDLYMHPDFRIGKTGLEKTFDEFLRGKYGVKYVEVNAHEIPLRTLSVKEAQSGSALNLTIDIELQKFIANSIKDYVASVVVMNVNNGEILASVSSPSFDSNNFVEGVSNKYWQEINNDYRKPLNNKVLSAIYPPGSVFKLMVALAALEEGFDPNTKINCKGYYKLGKRNFRCWKESGHGPLDLKNAIKHSCNTYFFSLAQQLGYDKFASMARKFGYGQKIDINLQGASLGNIPSKYWKEKYYKMPWLGGDTLNAAIGQGFILATPMQIALSTARIANGGIAINPHIVRNYDVMAQLDRLGNRALVKSKNIKFIQDAMYKVVNEKKGTAYYQRLKIDNFEMAGKTGTAQVISRKQNEIKKQTDKIKGNHAIFAGFAPFNNPKYAISVVVEHGGSGSAVAAPIAKKVMTKLANI